MSYRDITFQTGSIYHVYNKELDRKNVFSSKNNARHFIETMLFYRSSKTPMRFSVFKKLQNVQKAEIEKIIFDQQFFNFEILCYCLMPNHFHLLLKQTKDAGITKSMSNCLNSFTRYFNIKNNRKGPIYNSQFKAVEIKSDEQLKHVSRYIHLNPFSSKVVKTKDDLEFYQFSSYKNYINRSINGTLVNLNIVMSLFGNDELRYRKFVLENADYQSRLEFIKHTYKW